MKVEKLYTGQKFKNYKEMCSILEIEVKKSTKSKKYQFIELERFCTYRKSGHSILIDQVFETPKDKVDNRGKSEGSRRYVYGEVIQLLIADLLARVKDNRISISRGQLLQVINMTNINYGYAGENVTKLSEYANINNDIIYDFYNTTNSNFKSAIESALNALMDKRVIWYEIVTKIKRGEISDIANEEEKELIMKKEAQVLDEMGYATVSQVRMSADWKKFKRKVKKLLNETTSIEYYYFAYNIIVNDEFVEKERDKLLEFLIEDDKCLEYKKNLNTTVCENLLHNAEKRIYKANNPDHWGKSLINKKELIRLMRKKPNYLEDIKKLIDLLINDKTVDLRTQITETDVSNRFEEIDWDQVEDLFK
ncbi:hypothetical protein [Bacillus sp. Hm123]|uniref:hypothetical protein n=1 Tax=Bacillus sp. Hm123 TaxID=3450745 RepID=UPI003F4327E4